MKYLNYTDIMQMFGVNKRVAQTFLKQADMPSVRVGNKYYIDDEVLQIYLQEKRKSEIQNGHIKSQVEA